MQGGNRILPSKVRNWVKKQWTYNFGSGYVNFMGSLQRPCMVSPPMAKAAHPVGAQTMIGLGCPGFNISSIQFFCTVLTQYVLPAPAEPFDDETNILWKKCIIVIKRLTIDFHKNLFWVMSRAVNCLAEEFSQLVEGNSLLEIQVLYFVGIIVLLNC